MMQKIDLDVSAPGVCAGTLGIGTLSNDPMCVPTPTRLLISINGNVSCPSSDWSELTMDDWHSILQLEDPAYEKSARKGLPLSFKLLCKTFGVAFISKNGVHYQLVS
jgi:hypothetical protein